ncbi:MAG: Holliday junction resolvase RuvX [Ignavibacteriales bacterium]|nr:Holliday junction resolvase RuvX [Ignavibacteriales bacterium]MBI3788511.1 Holliday junction resolvase RuvX [Ignavibacteriales bacterium]
MNEQKRVLGIDYGSKRIGISVSDPLQIIAQALETIPNNPRTFETITEIVQREEVGSVVVGMPLNLKGEKAQKAQEVMEFIKQLQKTIDIEILTWDERFTSSLAHDTLLRMGTKKKERQTNKGRVDSMAAAIMLQSFLDSRKRSLVC